MFSRLGPLANVAAQNIVSILHRPEVVITPPLQAALIFLPERAGNGRKSQAISAMVAGQFLSGGKICFNTNF